MAYIPGKKQAPKAKGSDSIICPASSFLQSAKYNESSSELIVDFKNGESVPSFSFPKSMWDQFKESPSKGSFYSRMIKGKFGSIIFNPVLKVSDLEKAIKENRPKRK